MAEATLITKARVRIEPIRDRCAPFAGTAARIIAGLLWLANTDWKRPPDFGRDADRGLWVFTNHGIENEVFGPFRWVLEDIVIPNFELFGWITIASEVTLAALLLSGTFTRFAGLLGVGQAVAITLSVLNTPGEYNWAYYMMIGLHLAIIGLGGGPWSVDAVIAKAKAGDRARVLRSVTAGSYAVGGLLIGAGAWITYELRDRPFSVSESAGDYYRAIVFGNQSLRGSMLLGITLIVIGLATAAIATRPVPARGLGAALLLFAIFSCVTYGTTANPFGSAPSTAAITGATAAFLLAAAWALGQNDHSSATPNAMPGAVAH